MATIPVIKNIESLSTTTLRKDALQILEAGYEAVLTDVVLREEVELRGNDICIKDINLCLTDYERIFYIAFGKCAVDASLVMEKLLGNHLTDGVVIDVKEGQFTTMRGFVGTHPFPSPQNVSATQEVVKMLEGVTERDLVFVVVSGGGSSLLCLPHKIESETISTITHALWAKGAAIDEVNIVRKHISDIHGGHLARLAYPATVVSFIFSDVPGNDVATIASGPTVLDRTTKEDAEKVMAKYDVRNVCQLPDCELVETPKDQKYFARVRNILLVTNDRALEAMRSMAQLLGYSGEIKNARIEGIANSLGEKLGLAAMPSRSCHLYGGETTVEIRGKGKGGRNQELALGALKKLSTGRVVVAVASDGWDNTDIAGAITDSSDREKADGLGLSIDGALERNDSYPFWKTIGGSIETGRTGINVADFTIVLNA